MITDFLPQKKNGALLYHFITSKNKMGHITMTISALDPLFLHILWLRQDIVLKNLLPQKKDQKKWCSRQLRSISKIRMVLMVNSWKALQSYQIPNIPDLENLQGKMYITLRKLSYIQNMWAHEKLISLLCNRLFAQWNINLIRILSCKFTYIRHFVTNLLQLRDLKNDFIFNFNFDDKLKIFEKFEFRAKSMNTTLHTPEKMSWAKAHLNLCKLLETELTLSQLMRETEFGLSDKFKLFKDFYYIIEVQVSNGVVVST